MKETSDRAAVGAATRVALRNGACRTPKSDQPDSHAPPTNGMPNPAHPFSLAVMALGNLSHRCSCAPHEHPAVPFDVLGAITPSWWAVLWLRKDAALPSSAHGRSARPHRRCRPRRRRQSMARRAMPVLVRTPHYGGADFRSPLDGVASITTPPSAFVSSSACMMVPSSSLMRSRSRNPNASVSQAIAAPAST